jgi:hypothetical protein
MSDSSAKSFLDFVLRQTEFPEFFAKFKELFSLPSNTGSSQK